MSKTVFLVFLVVGTMVSCKRNYTCACGDMNSTERVPVMEIHGTKEKAQKKCDKYHDSQVSFPEWVCEIQ